MWISYLPSFPFICSPRKSVFIAKKEEESAQNRCITCIYLRKRYGTKKWVKILLSPWLLSYVPESASLLVSCRHCFTLYLYWKTHFDLPLRNRSDSLSGTSVMGEQVAKDIELLKCPHPSLQLTQSSGVIVPSLTQGKK